MTTAEQVVDALVKVDPVYDCISCFMCGCLTPSPDDDREDVQRGEDHRDGCPWWMARQLRGLPPWPEERT